MKTGKWNCILDSFWGSSGKGKASAWLADRYGVTLVSSSNFPNAGHTALFEDGTKFVAKAIPTAAILKKTRGLGMKCFVSPGSGFFWPQLIKEWAQSEKPDIFIHSRASIVTPDHAERERNGAESTKHIASTMQGSAAAIVDKVLRKADCILAGKAPLEEWLRFYCNSDPVVSRLFEGEDVLVDTFQEFLAKVHVVEAFEFRNLVHSNLEQGHTFLHEGSQGYSLSIDHGSHFPHCTSRNCSLQAAMDHMAIPPALVGDVYLNLRSFPIRVGNVVEDGVQKGFSGGFYPDCKELTWEQIASDAGMPKEEADKLAERERTTVTKRIRRVCNFSFIGLKDAVRTNGATKLIMNFIQYIDWKDAGLKGGPEEVGKLSKKSRQFLAKVEEAAGIPIVLIGTGPLHDDVIVTM
jgi:adenylosuccinate synthase